MSRARAATPAAKRRSGGRAKAAPAGRRRSAPAKAKAKPKARTSRAKAKARRPTPKTNRSTKRPAKRPKTRRVKRPKRARATKAAPKRPWRYRLAVVAILVACVGAGYLFWLRDSSLVAVTDVEVVGVTSGDRERIVGELTRIAERQTTLHVDAERIERAATAHPTVKAVSVDPNFPHGMRIEITERPPALVAESAGRRLAVAADGTVLAGVAVSEDEGLPVLELDQLPQAGTLEGQALQQALVLGAAPEPLRPLVEDVAIDGSYGVEVTLRGEIPVRFGSGAGAPEKWAAAAAVLASPKVDALTYLDVRVPERPAVGGNA